MNATLLSLLAPETLLVLLGMALMLWEAFASPKPEALGRAAFGGIVAIGLGALALPVGDRLLWNDLYIWDDLGLYLKEFFLLSAALTTWITLQCGGREQVGTGRAEFYIVPLFATAGMCLLASVHDFILLFVALELLTVSFYVLVAFRREESSGLEAGVKYLVIGAFASAFLVMGIAYVFGFAGSTQFDRVAGMLETRAIPAGLLFGLFLVVVGLGFKAAAVPFHVWAPDVYQGAPTPVTAFLSVASKGAAFAVLLRVFDGPFGGTALEGKWTAALGVLAVLSLILGSLAGMPQRNIKRLMAYAGIAHAGFLLAALAANSKAGHEALLFYLPVYLLSTFPVFLVVALAARVSGKETIQDFVGLGRRAPLLAWATAVALVSLAGLPPLAGFFAKFLVLFAAWQSGQYVIVAVGVLSVVAALYYYLAIVRAMFWMEPAVNEPIPLGPGTQALLWAMMAATAVLGLWVGPLLRLIDRILL